MTSKCHSADAVLINYLLDLGLKVERAAPYDEEIEGMVWRIGFTDDDGSEPLPLEFRSRQDVWRWWRTTAADLAFANSFAAMIGKACGKGNQSAHGVRVWAEKGFGVRRPDLVTMLFSLHSSKRVRSLPGWTRKARVNTEMAGYPWSLDRLILRYTARTK
jgi:hypothetical protein